MDAALSGTHDKEGAHCATRVHEHPEVTFLRARRRGTGISIHYLQGHWTDEEAFRELYQNLKDGILRSFRLNLSQFQPNYHEDPKTGRIEITIADPETRKLYGYILYRPDGKDREQGVVEICNFEAQIEDDHLLFGSTSKHADRNQAGQFGEGLKVAILVLTRSGYHVHLTTKCSSVNCYVVEEELHMNINPLRKINKIRTEFSDYGEHLEQRPLDANPLTDVCWTIGDGMKHTQAAKRKVARTDFMQWLSITLDIQAPPKSFIQTRHGKLIFDTHHAGKLFLRGLLLPDGSASGKDIRYCYDLTHGTVSRDRRQLSRTKEEAGLLCLVWCEAIKTTQDPARRSQLLHDYISMLSIKDGDDSVADVHIASQFISKEFATWLWTHLLDETSKEDPAGFYYHELAADKEVNIIQNCLSKTPKALSRVLWELLYTKHSLCRSAKEEREFLFRHAELVQTSPDALFACTILRLLTAILCMDQATKDKSFEIIDGGTLDLRTLYDDKSKTWKIEKKLLDRSMSHRTHFGCYGSNEREESTPSNAAFFWCDHAVLKIYERMLQDLTGNDFALVDESEIEDHRDGLLSKASMHLRRIPQGVTAEATNNPREIKVEWTSFEGMMLRERSQCSFVVVLHEVDTCTMGQDLMHHSNNDNVPCGCDNVAIAGNNEEYLFPDLDSKQYFATVRYNNPCFSIYSLPSQISVPKALHIPRTEMAQTILPTLQPAKLRGRGPANTDRVAFPSTGSVELDLDENRLDNDLLLSSSNFYLSGAEEDLDHVEAEAAGSNDIIFNGATSSQLRVGGQKSREIPHDDVLVFCMGDELTQADRVALLASLSDYDFHKALNSEIQQLAFIALRRTGQNVGFRNHLSVENGIDGSTQPNAHHRAKRPRLESNQT